MPAGAPAALPYQVARTSQEFADDVLDAAPVPAGARAWYGRVPEALSEPPATGAQDRFHVYVVSDASASRLLQYVPAHLAGARYVGGASGGLPLEWEEFSLPVAGPHEHSAALGYSLAAESGGYCPDAGLAGAPCLLRVDALTVWEPSRAAGEVVPVRDTVLLTAYSSVSLAGGPSSTYSVRLEWPQSTELVRQLDALPLGPGAGCMETAVAYRIVLKPATGPGPNFEVEGQTCAAVVELSAGGHALHPLYDRGCALFNLVRRLAPTRAKGTRSAVMGCAAT